MSLIRRSLSGRRGLPVGEAVGLETGPETRTGTILIGLRAKPAVKGSRKK